MRRHGAIRAIVAAALLAIGRAPEHVAAQVDTDAITFRERHAVQSTVLGEEREYWVSLPSSYDDTLYATQAYPVLYVLDADWNFRLASAMAEFMSVQGRTIPELIVVGLPNTARVRDFTPTHSRLNTVQREAEYLAGSGGGDAFLRFVREELFPEIESRYRTVPYRILGGHSLGGLLALHALMAAPEMFHATIAIDPSLWFDDQRLLRDARAIPASVVRAGRALYLAQANMTIPSDNPFNRHRASIAAFDAFVRANDVPEFHYAYRHYDRDGHSSVPLPGLHDGLRHIFDGYWTSVAEVVDDPASIAPRFERLSARLGITLRPSEAMIDEEAGYTMDEEGNVDAAIGLFRMNTRNYPDSWHAHARLGDAYAANGETHLAIASYERSLALKPDNPRVEESLEGLRSKL